MNEHVKSLGIGIADRLSRAQGRTGRDLTANVRVTRAEQEELRAAAQAAGKARGEWAREVLLREARRGCTDAAIFTELIALRLLMTNVLRPLALGETLTRDDFQAILAGVRKDKHDAARDLLAQYRPSRTEEQ